MAEIKTGDAGVGFDDNDNPGFDTSETNDIVRSFDKVFYSFNLNLNSKNKELYTDIVLEITGKVKNGVTANGKSLNARFPAAYGGSVNLPAKESRVLYKIGRDGNEGANTGSNRMITLPLDVYGAKNDTELNMDEFEVRIMSAKDSNGDVHDLRSENIVEKIQSLKDIRVSSKINLRAHVDNSFSYHYESFNALTKSTDDAHANLRQVGITVAVAPLIERGTSLLGSASPQGKVTLKMTQNAKKIDVSPGIPAVSTDLTPGINVRPLEIFDYGLMGNNIKYQNEMGTPYPDYIRLPNSSVYAPGSKDNGQDNTVMDTGNVFMKNNLDYSFDVSFDSYTVDLLKIVRRTYPHNPGTVYYDAQERPFLSAAMYIKEPTELLENYVNLNFGLDVQSITVEEEDGITVINKPATGSSTWRHNWAVYQYPPGSMASYAKYFDSNGTTLGSSTNGVYNSGDSVATNGQIVIGKSVISNGALFNAYESDLLQKFNPKEGKFQSAAIGTVRLSSGEGTTKTKPLKYGVSKTGKYDLKSLNNNRINDYTWYDTKVAAESMGDISAVLSGNIGKRVGNTYESMHVYRTLNSQYTGTVDDEGNPFATITWGRLYYDKDKLKSLEDPATPNGSQFKPAVYNDNGLQSAQTPMARYGDTLLIVPFNLTVNKYAFNPTGVETKSYQSSDVVNWELRPRITTTAKGTLPEVEVTIKDELPKGMAYIADSSSVGATPTEPTVNGPDAAGKTTLTWKVTAVPGKEIGKIKYKTSFLQSSLSFNTSGIASLTNKVVLSAPGNNSSESLRSKSYTVNVIKEQKWEIDKTVNKQLVEANSPDLVTYTLKVSNQTGKEITDVNLLDVLPKSGDISSVFSGDVLLKKISILRNDRKVNADARGYYTEDDIDRNENPNEIADDLFSWDEYTTELNTSDPNTQVEATSVFATIPVLKDNESAYVEITVQMKGNFPGDIYRNIASGNAGNFKGVINSQNQTTRVINRLIKGRVWFDSNYSGGIDSTEEFKKDVPVTLYKVDGSGNKTKVKKNISGEEFISASGTVLKKTDGNGAYEFEALPAGDYVVGFDLGNQIVTKDLYITKYKAPGITDRNNNNVPSTPMEVDGTNYLTGIADKYHLPTVVNTIPEGEVLDVNLGILGKPKLETKKRVLDSKGNDIHKKGVKVGDTIRYEIDVSNPSPFSVIENVMIRDTIPEGLTFVAGSLEIKEGTSTWASLDDDRFDPTKRILTTELGDISDLVGPDGKVILGFNVTVGKDASGTLVNVAKVSGDMVDKPTTEEKTTNEVENNTPPLPTLSKSVNASQAELGDILTYTLKVGNIKGGGQWEKVTVTDILPNYLTYVVGTTKVDGTSKPDTDIWSDQTLTLPLGKIQSEDVRTITFDVKVTELPSNLLIVNKVNATGTDKHNKPYAPEEAKVETPMDYYLLNIRQVVLNNDGSELVIPSKGYYQVTNQEKLETPSPLSSYSMVSGSTTKDKSADIEANLYTSRYLSLDSVIKGVGIFDRIPEYYDYVGHIATTDKVQLKTEHLSSLLPSDSQNKQPFLDYSTTKEYWVTIYIEPKYGKETSGTPEESPRPYSWSEQVNHFGKLIP